MTQEPVALHWRMSTITWTAACTLACMLASGVYAYFIFRDYPFDVLEKAVVSALVLPVFVGAPSYYVLIRRMRSLTFRNLRLQAASARDGLTHCFNQTAFRRMVEDYLKRRAGRRDCKGALLVIDADHFKLINDSLGHDNGDAALKLIAERVRKVVRRKDIVGRIGGEEFGVLLRDADLNAAAAVAERIRQSVDIAEFATDGGHHQLSVSVGGIVFEDEVSFSTLFRRADRLLYSAKEGGRNRVEIGTVHGPALIAA